MIPKDPLERFVELHAALVRRRKWYDSVMPLRYSAITVATTEGTAEELTEKIFSYAGSLKESAGWFGPLNSSIRFSVASVLVQAGVRPESFSRRVEELRSVFREEKLPRGAIYEVLAVLVLDRSKEEGRRANRSDVRRLAAIFRRLKEDRRWLTQADDFPACALLVSTGDEPEEIGPRVKDAYSRLRKAGLPPGNPLQAASHILYFCPVATDRAVDRFLELRRAFRALRLRVFQTEFDELAILSFLDTDADRLAQRVKTHREVLRDRLRPRPDRGTALSLAASTAFLEVLAEAQHRGRGQGRLALDAGTLMQVQSVLAAQQTAAIAAVAATSAGAAAASSS